MLFENSISIQALANLPEISAIYAVTRQSGEIIYIGQSKQLRSRWQGHHRLAQVQAIDPAASLLWFACETERLKTTEDALIQQHQPLLNGSPVLEKKRIASEKILQSTLAKIAPYTAVFGLDRQEYSATVVIKYFGYLPAGMSSRLRTILKGKWVEFVKRKHGAWWRFKCNGFQFELGPWLSEDTPTRTAMNSDMARVLWEKYFPGQRSIDNDEWKAIRKQKRTLEENLELIRTTQTGPTRFPLQSQAVLSQLATVRMLSLTQVQLNHINLSLESLSNQDPIPLFNS